MNESGSEDLQEMIRPVTSLISKSEKAQQKLVPGAWQHAMLQENLKALRIALALMTRSTKATELPEREELQAALSAFAAMTKRSEKAQAKFPPGTPQYTLQQNRLKAFRTAEAIIHAELT